MSSAKGWGESRSDGGFFFGPGQGHAAAEFASEVERRLAGSPACEVTDVFGPGGAIDLDAAGGGQQLAPGNPVLPRHPGWELVMWAGDDGVPLASVPCPRPNAVRRLLVWLLFGWTWRKP